MLGYEHALIRDPRLGASPRRTGSSLVLTPEQREAVCSHPPRHRGAAGPFHSHPRLSKKAAPAAVPPRRAPFQLSRRSASALRTLLGIAASTPLGHELVELGLVLRHPQPVEKFPELLLLLLEATERLGAIFVECAVAARALHRL